MVASDCSGCRANNGRPITPNGSHTLRGKLQEFKIAVGSIYLAKGAFDFVDVVEASDPAFDSKSMDVQRRKLSRAAKSVRAGKG